MQGKPGRPVKKPPARVIGMVERLGEAQIFGWVMVPTSAPPAPVSLHLGPIKLSSTYPTPGGALARMEIAQDSARPPTAQGTALKRAVGSGVAVGRADGRRNVRDGFEERSFTFKVRDIWAYLRQGNRVTVRYKGQPLPISGHGIYFSATKDGKYNLRLLQERLDEGFILTQMGEIVLSKRLDEEWQRRVAGLYTKVREVVAERYGYDVFIAYGTLLGSVREGGYISHDADFDSAYISQFHTGREAAEELLDVAMTLIDAGLEVDLRQRLLHVHDPEDPSYRIDVFHLYFDPEGRLRFPWGVAGTRGYTTDDFVGTELVDLPGGEVLRPINPEPLVAHLYGDDWRLPKPAFHWPHARTDVADDAVLTTAERDRVYWSNFYAHHTSSGGSTFFAAVSELDGLPGAVVDIGCGDGHDSFAFAQSGRTVLGIDQSAVAVQGATARAEQLGVADRAVFEVCDVSDPAALGAVLERFRGQHAGNVLFYLRFFLHSVTAEVQEEVLAHIRSVARAGDVFAAEFRTDKDEKRKKTFGNHYRRFQSAAEFRAALEGRFGFQVVSDQESDGLSPYGDEDPILYRVVARFRE
nr:methyltransferase domain-containing protein [Flexivirga oryzae]